MLPNLNQFIECWSYVLLSVGPVRLFLSQRLSTHNVKRSLFIYRDLPANKITGTIPCQISRLTALQSVYAQHIKFPISAGWLPYLVLVMRSSLMLSKFFSAQTTPEQCLDGPNPV